MQLLNLILQVVLLTDWKQLHKNEFIDALNCSMLRTIESKYTVDVLLEIVHDSNIKFLALKEFLYSNVVEPHNKKWQLPRDRYSITNNVI